MPTVELRTPTSFLFFVAAAVSTYYSIDQPAMTPFAISAFSFFIALGPIRWIVDAYIAAMKQTGNESRISTWVQVASYSSQCLLFIGGVGIGCLGITAAPL